MPVELVFRERRTHGVAPIIEVVRTDNDETRLHQVDDIVAVVTDAENRLEGSTLCEQFSFSDDDMERLADWITKELL